MQKENYALTIDQCSKLALECDRLIRGKIFSEELVIAYQRCARLLRECSSVCYFTIKHLSGNSEFVIEICQLCSLICKTLHAECEKLQMDVLEQCVILCEQCMEACKSSIDAYQALHLSITQPIRGFE